MKSGHPNAEYILPLRWESDEGVEAMGRYLQWLAERIDVTVVDGSPPERFAVHDTAWPWVRHVAPDTAGLNGKACGVVTGIRSARHDIVVIADDDVRYDDESLAAVLGRLGDADFVRPQNVFRPLPWHARWDTGRSLVNRALGGDFPGTVAVRRRFARGGYDTDVLFENLELERTVRSRGGIVAVARDVYVERRPPSIERFAEQRVRQAYDDFAQPARLVAELALLPLAGAALLTGHRGALLVGAAGAVGLAELGRRRGGGRTRFPRTAALWAPLWVCERAGAVWIAACWRVMGGVPYRGRRLRRAASSRMTLRRRARAERLDEAEGGQRSYSVE